MGYDHDRIKANARLFYRNNMGTSILPLLIFLGVSFAASMVMSILMTVVRLFIGVPAIVAEMQGNGDIDYSIGLLIVFYLISMAINYVAALGLLPLSIGLFGWYRKSIFQTTSLAEMFAPYTNGRLWSSIGTVFLRQLYTFLWSLLFIIPGIIKSYSYSQTIFIKAENPNIPANRAIELSKIMMEGHKGDLFYLHLSFIGWMILSYFTFNILGIVYVFPYFYSALSFAYVEVKADAIAKGLINPAEFNPVQEKYIAE